MKFSDVLGLSYPRLSLPSFLLFTISFSRLSMWPFMFHRIALMALDTSLRLFISPRMLSSVRRTIRLTRSILFQHQISKLSRIRCFVPFSIQVLQSYSAILHTYNFMNSFLILIPILLKHKTFIFFVNDNFACAILDLISMMHLSSITCILVYNSGRALTKEIVWRVTSLNVRRPYTTHTHLCMYICIYIYGLVPYPFTYTYFPGVSRGKQSLNDL